MSKYPYVQSPYHSSRGDDKPEAIVIHTTVGYYQGTINYFKSNTRKVSAHYVVKEDGTEATQMVDEKRAAHHAGLTSGVTAPFYKGYNPNYYTIGIENADNNNPHGHNRKGQEQFLVKLCTEICDRWGIPKDRNHIVGHRELYNKKTCPGNINVDKIVQLMNNNSNMTDDEKRALEELEKARKELNLGNLESTARIIIDLNRDFKNLKDEFDNYKKEEPTRIQTAVTSALSQNDIYWQSKIESANKKIEELEKTVEKLKKNQASELSYGTLFAIAIEKFMQSLRG